MSDLIKQLEAEQREECLRCNGRGRFQISLEMALAAGMPERAGETIVCGSCGGDGWVTI